MRKETCNTFADHYFCVPSQALGSRHEADIKKFRNLKLSRLIWRKLLLWPLFSRTSLLRSETKLAQFSWLYFLFIANKLAS